jgi:glycosyltransferase involved in cell wall biosynthesis
MEGRMTAVHQFVATFEPGAIGNEIIEAQRVLREAGFESEIFTEFGHDSYDGQWQRYEQYAKIAHDDDVLVYHMAIGSNVADWLLDRSERLVLRHHNITPVEYYSPWPDANTYGMSWGRDQLRRFAPRSVLGLAASEFNRHELEALRFSRTATAPVFFDFASFDRDVDTDMVEQMRSTKRQGGADLLFVGWIAPHKCQHDAIRAFSLYRRLYDSNARLHLVGRTALDSYEQACRKLTSELELDSSVTFYGRLSDGELGAMYASADAFVCMSEHEGVGLPLLESMHHGIPIVAFGAAAVPETVGAAGVVLPSKRPALVAAAIRRLLTDTVTRDALTAMGKQQLHRFSYETAKQRWLDELQPLAS